VEEEEVEVEVEEEVEVEVIVINQQELPWRSSCLTVMKTDAFKSRES
jgi:hypothetical protein